MVTKDVYFIDDIKLSIRQWGGLYYLIRSDRPLEHFGNYKGEGYKDRDTAIKELLNFYSQILEDIIYNEIGKRYNKEL